MTEWLSLFKPNLFINYLLNYFVNYTILVFCNLFIYLSFLCIKDRWLCLGLLHLYCEIVSFNLIKCSFLSFYKYKIVVLCYKDHNSCFFLFVCTRVLENFYSKVKRLPSLYKVFCFWNGSCVQPRIGSPFWDLATSLSFHFGIWLLPLPPPFPFPTPAPFPLSLPSIHHRWVKLVYLY